MGRSEDPTDPAYVPKAIDASAYVPPLVDPNADGPGDCADEDDDASVEGVTLPPVDVEEPKPAGDQA